MFTFQKGDKIGNYEVNFPIKQGAYAETYRVKDGNKCNFFLKLINFAKLHRTQFEAEGRVVEIEIAKNIVHKNICTYHDSGELVAGNQRFVYLVTDFISGETVAQRITREQTCSVFDTKNIAIGVLEGLKYLHSLPRAVIHNEITPQNIMLDMSTDPNTPRIIDFGYARYFDQGAKAFTRQGLNPFYVAPEAMNGIYTPQSDLFSVGATLYHLIYGMPPYFVDLSGKRTDEAFEAVCQERERGLKLPERNLFELDENLLNTIAKSLEINIDDRFATIDDFIRALKAEVKIEHKTQQQMPTKPKNINRKVGRGFADVAGMDDLKKRLKSDVIDVINDPEGARDYGVSIPDGLLFYGPPGCGKTFFAEKFAEESGYNYRYIKCSDVASPYIHGGQEKIAAIFAEAEKNAPTILFFDEIEAMITDRSKHNNVSESGEVNEFLAQLNNCGERGILVIGATNKPTTIDSAALRSGRLALKYYIAPPDFEARKEMFRIALEARIKVVDFGIEYEKLAQMTENFVSADITELVETAARTARSNHEKITQALLESVIANQKPTVSLAELKRHEAIRDEFEGKKQERTRIGFH